MTDSAQGPLSEFDIIARYFTPSVPAGMVGVGDDCAIIPVRPGYQLAVSTDTLIQERHFYGHTPADLVGHKALAVNLSDLAAMGARPRACLLSLSLPRVDEQWLQDFSVGFHQLCTDSGCVLIGGDTTRSNHGIIITVTVLGEVPVAQALLRNRAQPDDDIWLTGHLGAPYVALQLLGQHWPANPDLLKLALPRLQRPIPPYHWAPELLGHAHAAIDISDGLIQDLQHILGRSEFGAQIECAKLPQHSVLQHLDEAQRYEALLAGGDEFELCFTASPKSRAYILDSAAKAEVAVHRVGKITLAPELQIYGFDGQRLVDEQRFITASGFDHFAQ